MGLASVSVAFVGAGAMGGALARGLAASGRMNPEDVACYDLSDERLAELAEQGITCLSLP